MDIVLIVIGFIFVIFGVIGAILPVLPGPILGWIGLLLLQLSDKTPFDSTFIIITFVVSVLITFLDYIIPVIGTKKYGGTKYGMYGSLLGLIIGIFLGPAGIILGPFFGAFIGEYLHDSSNTNKALRAAYGSFIGFLFSTGLKLIVSLTFLILFIKEIWILF
jgi:uncharacterized protein YqgC (DUF456 family)